MYTAIANLVSGPRPDSLERVCIAATTVIDITYHQCTETETHPSPWQFQWPMTNIKSFGLPNHLHSIHKISPPSALFLYGSRFLNLLYRLPAWEGQKPTLPGLSHNVILPLQNHHQKSLHEFSQQCYHLHLILNIPHLNACFMSQQQRLAAVSQHGLYTETLVLVE